MRRLPETIRRRARELRGLHERFGDPIFAEQRLLALAFVALGGEVLFQLLTPFPIKYLFDGLLIPDGNARLIGVPGGFPAAHPYQFLALVAGAMIVFPLLAGLFSYHRTLWSATAGQRIVMKLRKRLYAHLHRLSLRFHRQSRLGDLLLRITGDIPMLRDVLSESFIDLVGRLLSVVVTLLVLFLLDPTLALVSLVVLGSVALLSALFTRRIAHAAKRQRRKEGLLAYTAAESLGTLTLIKALGREQTVVDRFARQNRTSLRKGLLATRLQARLSRWVETVFAIGVAVVTVFGVARILGGGALSAGDLLVFVALVRNLNKPLRKISRISGRIGKAAACGERILEILRIEPEEIDRPGARPAPALAGEVGLSNLSFSYDGRDAALDGLNLTVAAGERVALVGRNGAGKTTLIHLLLRFYEPSSGRICVDGVDVRRYTLKSLRDQIAIALQDTHLLGASIRDNLSFSAPDATESEMLAALDAVGADFVASLPEGLDTSLAEGGADLSGGERRKLSLAGTLLRRTPVLILDEPTTHIDSGSRNDILAGLPKLTQGRTTLIITHDQKMLNWVDRVVFLEDGRVAGAGSHGGLLERIPSYRNLFPAAAPGRSSRAS